MTAHIVSALFIWTWRFFWSADSIQSETGFHVSEQEIVVVKMKGTRSAFESNFFRNKTQIHLCERRLPKTNRLIEISDRIMQISVCLRS